jgi:hypothetical protein
VNTSSGLRLVPCEANRPTKSKDTYETRLFTSRLACTFKEKQLVADYRTALYKASKRSRPPTHTSQISHISTTRFRSHASPSVLCQVPTSSISSRRRYLAMEAAFLSLSPELRDALAKVAVFVIVQALVYLILRSSSNVLSKDSSLRSLSFRPMRSMSVTRILAPLSDVPVGTDEPSTSPTLSSAASRRKAGHDD